MREIKFRGKRIDNVEWVEGFYIKHIFGDETVHYIVDEKFNFEDSYTPLVRRCVKVHPETVGQMLEIGDCTGEELFDGDIFIDKASKDKCPQKYVIKYSDLGWYMEPDYEPRDLFGLWERNRIKKVGTIYENPELLEDK